LWAVNAAHSGKESFMRRKDNTGKILTVIFFIGLSLLLYPTVSNRWNSFHQSQAVSAYSEKADSLDEDKYADIWNAAEEYNASLWGKDNGFYLPKSQKTEYESLLNLSGNGIMGYIDIPSINCVLPIYHGSDEAVLQVGAGHLEWSSLPVGGESSHCVLSGHRGLPSARLFTDLDKLSEGDRFVLKILNETLTYEVDRILIVEPEETDPLLIEEGKDYCTLVTCTPYGINTHRLLVRAHRTENENIINITADAVQAEPMITMVIAEAIILLVLLAVILISDMLKRRAKKNGGDIYGTQN